MSTIIINTEPIEIKHISWYTQKGATNEEIILFEVIEVTYDHPLTDLTIVKQIETRYVKTYKRINYKSSHSILLEAAMQTVDRLEGIK